MILPNLTSPTANSSSSSALFFKIFFRGLLSLPSINFAALSRASSVFLKRLNVTNCNLNTWWSSQLIQMISHGFWAKTQAHCSRVHIKLYSIWKMKTRRNWSGKAFNLNTKQIERKFLCEQSDILCHLNANAQNTANFNFLPKDFSCYVEAWKTNQAALSNLFRWTTHLKKKGLLGLLNKANEEENRSYTIYKRIIWRQWQQKQEAAVLAQSTAVKLLNFSLTASEGKLRNQRINNW